MTSIKQMNTWDLTSLIKSEKEPCLQASMKQGSYALKRQTICCKRVLDCHLSHNEIEASPKLKQQINSHRMYSMYFQEL